jgi:PncC family amidohydrolase
MISKDVFKLCANNGLTIAFAESMTGGSLAYEMIKNPGSSKVISGSVIAYSIDQKKNLLHLSDEQINSHSVVSEYVAKEMATAIKSIMNSDIGVGVTGNAGPEKQMDTNNLECWIAINFKGKIMTQKLLFNHLTRLQSIKKTIQTTYEMLKDCF